MRGKESLAEIGAESARIILTELQFSPEQILEVAYLVTYHDHLDGLDTKNRRLVFEADSLAQINWNVVTPNFGRENCLRFFAYFKEHRVPRFSTETGKKFLQQLLPEAEKYWE